MIISLPKRGSFTLTPENVYQVSLFPCFLYVTELVVAQQDDSDIFDNPFLIIFGMNRQAELTKKYIRVDAEVKVAIKKDSTSPVKR